MDKILSRIKSDSISDVIDLYYRHLKHAEGCWNDSTVISCAPDENGNIYATFYVDPDTRRYKNI